jgi:orotidine-5'-phosphate decarboxylase
LTEVPARAFTERLRTAQLRAASALCVGLDVDPRRLPVGLSRDRAGIEVFLRGIIEATADLACAYKPNLGFFEALGDDGFPLLRDTLRAIPPGVITIADGKRGDIGATAERYATALFEVLGFDAATVNPYQGRDSVEPYVEQPAHGAFLLCKTSNPGSEDFQDLLCGEPGRQAPLYEVVALRAVQWNTRQNVGLVVGATYPDQLSRVRLIAPGLPILVPGVGTQGGDAAESIRRSAAHDGTLGVINVSRQILYASEGSDWREAARREALALRDAMRSALAEGPRGAHAR